MLEFRLLQEKDKNDVWNILKERIQPGDSFTYSPDLTKEEMLSYWCHADRRTYVAVLDGKVAGTFFIKDNQPGLGSHIANAGYAVAKGVGGQGVGYAMGEFSLTEAKRLGYHAMQFNIVVKSNVNAVKLWQKLGFEIIGEIPDAFQHRQNGLTNAYIMYRKL